MIIEGLLTTVDEAGQPHVAPMGPVVDRELQNWLLRPFQSSQTFENLRRSPDGIFHVVDDALTVVRAVLNLPLAIEFRQHTEGVWMIESACHWYHLRVSEWNIAQPRSEARASIVETGILRPFWGWNRAKHAILEAAILATRLQILDRREVEVEFDRLENVVLKTAGNQELEAWELLRHHLRTH